MRAEIDVLNEQIEAFDGDVEDLRVRAVVSETPLSAKEFAQAARHAELAHRARREARESLAKVEAERDALLGDLVIDVVP